MDEVDPAVEARLKNLVDTLTGRQGLQYHGLPTAAPAARSRVEFHLLFAADTALASAHAVATRMKKNWNGSGRPRRSRYPLETLETTDRCIATAISSDCPRAESPASSICWRVKCPCLGVVSASTTSASLPLLTPESIHEPLFLQN